MATKAQQIIARFTSDPALTTKILGIIKDAKAGKHTIDSIIAQFTSDPQLASTIKSAVHKSAAVSKTNLAIVPASVRPDLVETSSPVGRVVNNHAAAIKQILAS
jgi:hypothetical protein